MVGEEVKLIVTFYQTFTAVINFCLFIFEITTAHICHSLLLHTDALYRLSQALLGIIQLISAKFFHLFREQNTFGLARIGLIAELINSIFLCAMMLSVGLEAVKHIIDNLTYNRLVLSGSLANSTRASMKEHRHFLINRPDVLAWVGLSILIVNTVQVSLYIWTKVVNKFNHRRRLGKVTEGVFSFKFAATASDVISQREVAIQIFCQIFGSCLVLSCGLIVSYNKSWLARYTDSILTFILIGNCVLTMAPVVREGVFVLLQNFPANLCLTDIKYDIMREVPDVVNVHDLHVWQHIPFSYICTMHVVFRTTDKYESKMRAIARVMLSEDIYHFTIQPEFLQPDQERKSSSCLIKCPEQCRENSCCTAHLDDLLVPEESTEYRSVEGSRDESVCCRASLLDDQQLDVSCERISLRANCAAIRASCESSDFHSILSNFNE